ncbi:MAG: CoA pyrophosphatase [Chitinophagales bacterium]|nr:CoA pyrophosphatase [Chitinophagales bacterium]
MTAETILDRLRQLNSIVLPGNMAQYKMAAYFKQIPTETWILNQNPKLGAVMILLSHSSDSIQLTLMKRPDYDGIHSGQISFFGGKKEEMDEGLLHTSIREAQEEGGFDTSALEYFGALSPLYIHASNYYIEPHVFYSADALAFNHDKNEVERIIEVDVRDIFQNKSTEMIHIKGRAPFEAPCYRLGSDIIWGATAMILSELEEILIP